MQKTDMKVIAALALLLCLCMAAGLLSGCGAAPSGGSNQKELGASLTANEAYQAAISSEEGEECTSDECTVTLYDDTDDNGDYPYNVLSPLGAVVSNP